MRRPATLFLALRNGAAARLAIPLALAWIGLAPLALHAQDTPPVFSEADAHDVEAVIERYFDAFSRGDFERFAGVFQLPYLQFAGQPVLVDSIDDIVDDYREIRAEVTKTPDYERSVADEVRITPLWQQAALAEVYWKRLKHDGTSLSEGAETMLLSKRSGEWKIAGWLGQDARSYGDLYSFPSQAEF